MTDDDPEKLKSTKNCLAVLEKLRQQMTVLKALDLNGDESQYVEASFAHIRRIQTCLSNLYFKIQDSLLVKEKRLETKHKNSRSIKR